MTDTTQAAATEQTTTAEAHTTSLMDKAKEFGEGSLDPQALLAHVTSTLAAAHAAGGEEAHKLAHWLSQQFHK